MAPPWLSLRRHGVGNLRDLKPKAAKPVHGSFKAYEPGDLHIDVKFLPQMADEERRVPAAVAAALRPRSACTLFVAIDWGEADKKMSRGIIFPLNRWVFVRIYPAQTAANARRFLRDLERAAPMRITRVLTDNGKEFTDRLFGLRRRAATGNHELDRLCAELGIAHRLLA